MFLLAWNSFCKKISRSRTNALTIQSKDRKIVDSRYSQLVEAITRNKSLETVQIRAPLSGRALSHLLAALNTKTTIKVLDLSDSTLDEEHLPQLLTLLKPPLHLISIFNTPLSVSCLDQVVSHICANSLNILFITNEHNQQVERHKELLRTSANVIPTTTQPENEAVIVEEVPKKVHPLATIQQLCRSMSASGMTSGAHIQEDLEYKTFLELKSATSKFCDWFTQLNADHQAGINSDVFTPPKEIETVLAYKKQLEDINASVIATKEISPELQEQRAQCISNCLMELEGAFSSISASINAIRTRSSHLERIYQILYVHAEDEARASEMPGSLGDMQQYVEHVRGLLRAEKLMNSGVDDTNASIVTFLREIEHLRRNEQQLLRKWQEPFAAITPITARVSRLVPIKPTEPEKKAEPSEDDDDDRDYWNESEDSTEVTVTSEEVSNNNNNIMEYIAKCQYDADQLAKVEEELEAKYQECIEYLQALLQSRKESHKPLFSSLQSYSTRFSKLLQQRCLTYEQQIASLVNLESELKALQSFCTQWVANASDIDELVSSILHDQQENDALEDELVSKQAILQKSISRGRPREDLQQSVTELKHALSARQQRFRMQQTKLSFLATTGGFPELLVRYPSHILSDAVSTTGLVVEKTLDSFISVEKISHSDRPESDSVMYKCQEAGGRYFAVKEFHLVNEDHRKSFEREVSILHRCKNELIIPIKCIFYDTRPEKGLFGYIQFPYFSSGNLLQWASTSPSQEQIRSIMRMVIQGVAYLHVSGILHRGLKLKHIMLDHDKPIITDFAFSKQTVDHLTNTTMISMDWTAPELQEGEPASEASDMYAIGMMLFELTFPGQSVLGSVNNQGNIDIPALEDDNLHCLLTCLLRSDKTQRPTADECLVHPYFTKVNESSKNNFAACVEVLREHFRMTRLSAGLSGTESVCFNRACVDDPTKVKLPMDTVFQYFGNFNNQQWLSILSVTFANEEGVDCGGLSTAFYEQFFEEVFSSEMGMFEKGSLDTYLPIKVDISSPNHAALCEKFTTFGKLITKCLYEGRNPSVKFNQVVYKYLIESKNVEISFNDMDMFDLVQSRNLRQLLITSNVDDLFLTFEGLCPDGVQKDVTDANKLEFVQLKLRYEMLESRMKYLECIREGLLSFISFEKQLNLFTHYDLKLLMLGQQHLSADDIKNILELEGLDESAATAMKETIDRFNSEELHLFLHFVTNELSIPIGGLNNPSTYSSYPKDKISIALLDSSRYPVAHTCWYRVDIPHPVSTNVLYSRFIDALRNHKHSAGAFFVA